MIDTRAHCRHLITMSCIKMKAKNKRTYELRLVNYAQENHFKESKIVIKKEAKNHKSTSQMIKMNLPSTHFSKHNDSSFNNPNIRSRKGK